MSIYIAEKLGRACECKILEIMFIYAGDKDNGVRFAVDGAMAVALMISCHWLMTMTILSTSTATTAHSLSSIRQFVDSLVCYLLLTENCRSEMKKKV